MPTSVLSCDLLSGCGSCCDGSNGGPGIRGLIESHVNAPFIFITVGGSAGTITVGNQSQPPENHAVVKSLKYGHTAGGGGGGLHLEVEVADEKGGAFATFVNSLVTKVEFDTIRFCNFITASWGWIANYCDGTHEVISSTTHTLVLQSVDFTYTGGLMKFNLKGIDLSQVAFQTSLDKTYGEDNSPLGLKQAIQSICQEYNCAVRFLRPGSDEEWNFGDSGTNGGQGDPNAKKASWKCHSENFLQAIQRWIQGYVTDRKLGITLAFNSKINSGDQPQLILWEDFMPQCGATLTSCLASMGTYIVNGGNDSPVISFQPNLKWTFGQINKSGRCVRLNRRQTTGGTGRAELQLRQLGQRKGRHGHLRHADRRCDLH
jgi:hypothetical protein